MTKKEIRIKKYEWKMKSLILFAVGLLMISVGLQAENAYSKEANSYEFDYEYINIKDMAQAKVASKSSSLHSHNVLMDYFNGNNLLVEVDFPGNKTVEEQEMPVVEPVVSEPKEVWYLPTEVGVVTQNPHYGHVALDITSPRGVYEDIFPVANGVVSGVYVDPAGALVVTVLHDIDGVKYTSQYAHLSRFANGLYVGKPVTINDSLGKMGTTGYSTGVHLHLAIVDCALFDSNDANCSDLNKFFRYISRRYNEGFIGLGTLKYVPGSWNNR